MRTTALIALLALPPAAQEPRPAPPADVLAVHEWGTFTTMVGSDGVALCGLHHEEEALPAFVHCPKPLQEGYHRGLMAKGLNVPLSHVTLKLETPVLYVHTRSARQLRIEVDFAQGLLTQWYPRARGSGPTLPEFQGRLDLRRIRHSTLAWDVDVLPAGLPAGTAYPDVAIDDPWAIAREVEAAPLRARGPGAVEAEHYVFYRGLGTHALPFAALAHGKGRGSFRNRHDHLIPSALVLEVRGDQARLLTTGTIDAQGAWDFDLAPVELRPKETVAELAHAAVRRALVEAGLAADEARAFVRTWSRSWFLQDGLRILYVVPRDLVDRILPLRITPQPDQLVRVLLGRMEVIPPETERAVAETLLAQHRGDAARAKSWETLLAFGRFLEPHLRRAAASAEDPLARATATRLLGEQDVSQDQLLKDLRGN